MGRQPIPIKNSDLLRFIMKRRYIWYKYQPYTSKERNLISTLDFKINSPWPHPLVREFLYQPLGGGKKWGLPLFRYNPLTSTPKNQVKSFTKKSYPVIQGHGPAFHALVCMPQGINATNFLNKLWGKSINDNCHCRGNEYRFPQPALVYYYVPTILLPTLWI